MKRKNARNVTDLLREFMRYSGLETPLNEFRLINSWEKVVGKSIASYTDKASIKIYNRKLYIHVLSAPLRQDLMAGRDILARRLNEEVGASVIDDIVFK